jgi:hypothetical protein
VITILVDHDMEGQAAILWGTIDVAEWQGRGVVAMVTLAQVGLPRESPDREVWRFAQAQGMLLLTNNRNSRGDDSLGRTIGEESSMASLPILTVSSLDRIADRRYRQRCAARILEIAADLDNYRGTGRIFIP